MFQIIISFGRHSFVLNGPHVGETVISYIIARIIKLPV